MDEITALIELINRMSDEQVELFKDFLERLVENSQEVSA